MYCTKECKKKYIHLSKISCDDLADILSISKCNKGAWFCYELLTLMENLFEFFQSKSFSKTKAYYNY